MADSFTIRLTEWRQDIGRRLRKKWWYVFILGPIGYVAWAVFMDGVIATIKAYSKEHLANHSLFVTQVSAIHPAAILRPLLGTLILCALGLLVLVVHAYLETRPVEPAQITVAIKELHRRSIVDSHRQQTGFDLFLRARVELVYPAKISLLQYKLELSRHGELETPQPLHDLERWRVLNLEPGDQDFDVQPLPLDLKSHEPVEGWLHFVTATTQEKRLEESAIRLIARTEHGSGNGEHPADAHIWNQRRLMFNEK